MTRVALITGGARGIGRAIAFDLSRDHDVALTWNTTRPETMRDHLPETILTVQADLRDSARCRSVIAEGIARFGRLEVIVNNAGLAETSPKDGFETDAFRATLDVNLLAPHALVAAALPHLKPGAAIVNISSVNAVLAPKDAAICGASKAALNLWTRGMAKELGSRQIRVNAVAPGAIHTPQAPPAPMIWLPFLPRIPPLAGLACGRISPARCGFWPVIRQSSSRAR